MTALLGRTGATCAFLAVALPAASGCDEATKAKNRAFLLARDLGAQTFKEHVAKGQLCPERPAEVWAYPSLDDSLPSPAGWLEGPPLDPPYVMKVPFWCAPLRSPSQVTKARALVTVELSQGKPPVRRLEVENLGSLSLGQQAWGWMASFLVAQLIIFIMFFCGPGLRVGAWLTGLCALPIGGYMSYRAFNGAGAVVLCLLLQMAVSAVLVTLLLRLAARR